MNTPGQVAFTPDGSQLIVTTKANGSSIDVFRVHRHGTLDQTPVVNAEPGTVPFAVTFDGAGNLVVTEAGTNAVATFDLHRNGTLTPLSSVLTGQMATCWIVGANGQFYASNAGSASVTRIQSGSGGGLTLLGNTTTDPGSVDAALHRTVTTSTSRPAATASSTSSGSTATARSRRSGASPSRTRSAAKASSRSNRSSSNREAAARRTRRSLTRSR